VKLGTEKCINYRLASLTDPELWMDLLSGQAYKNASLLLQDDSPPSEGVERALKRYVLLRQAIHVHLQEAAGVFSVPCLHRASLIPYCV